jgi:hypothetical protein
VVSFLFCIAIALSFWQQREGGFTTYEVSISILLGIIIIFGTLKYLKGRYTINRSLVYFLFFAFIIALNVFTILDTEIKATTWGWLAFVTLAFPLVSFVSYIEFNSLKKIRTFYIIIVVVCIIAIITFLVQVPFGEGMRQASIIDVRTALRGSPSGGIVDLSFLSAMALSLLFPFLFFRQRSFSLQSRFILAAFIISLIGLFFSFARSFWVSTALGMISMLYLLKRISGKKTSSMKLILIVAFSFLLCVFFLPTIWSIIEARASSIVSPFGHDYSLLERVYEGRGLLTSIVEHPQSLWLGNGFGKKFTFYSINPFTLGGVGERTKDYSHNHYLYLLWTVGIIGLSAFLMFVFSLFRDLRRAILDHVKDYEIAVPYKLMLVGIFGTFVNFLVAALLYTPFRIVRWNIYLGMLVGIGYNIIKYYRTDKSKDKLENRRSL